MAEPITVEGIVQEPTDRRRRPSGHVINAVLPIRKGQTFSSGVFFIFSTEGLFFGEVFFVFSESEHTQGVMPFAELSGISRMTP